MEKDPLPGTADRSCTVTGELITFRPSSIICCNIPRALPSFPPHPKSAGATGAVTNAIYLITGVIAGVSKDCAKAALPFLSL